MDVDEIAIKLGVKTGDFKAALADANAKIVEFKHAGESNGEDGLAGTLKQTKMAMREFKEFLVAGGVLEAVKSFFEFAISRAEELKFSTNKNVIAVQEFSEALKADKSTVADWAVNTLGFLNRIGSTWGDTLKVQTAFFKGGVTGAIIEKQAQDQAEESATAARAAEKKLAEERKLYGAELIAINKEIKQSRDEAEAAALKGTDVYQTQANIAEHLADLLQKQQLGEGTILDKKRLELEVIKTQKDLEEAVLAVKKQDKQIELEMGDLVKSLTDERREQVADQVKRTEEALDLSREDLTLADRKKSILREIQQIEEELYYTDRTTESGKAAYLEGENRLQKLNLDLRKEQNDQGKNNVEIAQLLLKGVANLNPLEKERLALLQGQTTEHKEQVELQQLLDKGVDNLTAAEKVRLEVLAGQTGEVKKQIAETADLIAEWDKFSTSITRTGTSYDQQSTAALEGVIQRLQQQLTQVDATGREIKDATINEDYGGWLTANTIRGELAQAMQVLQERAQIQGTIKTLGENAARSQYGDTATDNALREMQTATQQTATSVNQIHQLLNKTLGSG